MADDPRGHLRLIDHLRGTPSPAADEPDERLVAHDVLMCGPVAVELLTGLDAAERMRLWETSAMAWPTSRGRTGPSPATLRAELRARGIQVSLVDVLIAGAAAKCATL